MNRKKSDSNLYIIVILFLLFPFQVVDLGVQIFTIGQYLDYQR